MRTTKQQGSKTKQHKESDHNPGGSPNTSATNGGREDRSRNADMGVGDGQEDEKGTDTDTGEPKPDERKRQQPRPHAGGHRAQ